MFCTHVGTQIWKSEEVPTVWCLSVEYGGSNNCVTTIKNQKGVEAKGPIVNVKVQTHISNSTANSSRPQLHLKNLTCEETPKLLRHLKKSRSLLPLEKLRQDPKANSDKHLFFPAASNG